MIPSHNSNNINFLNSKMTSNRVIIQIILISTMSFLFLSLENLGQ